MLKAPVPGTVKTRLASAIGAKQATLAYMRMVELQLKALQDYNHEIHYTPGDSLQQMKDWLGDGHSYHPQTKGDLGQRMSAALKNTLENGASKACLLGGDCPYINHAVIEEASSALDQHDLSIGPAMDGGYYLLACKHLYQELFEDIAWSTEIVFKKTLSTAENLGLNVYQLKPLEDVDDLQSWERARKAKSLALLAS